jgi:hypothetical protein
MICTHEQRIHLIPRYRGLSATVDPTQFPDPWFYFDCLKDSFAELRAAATDRAPSREERVRDAQPVPSA